ncbi:MAG: PmbA/TldA family metallopeptidase, partial [Tumebacillaceae bacterium]
MLNPVLIQDILNAALETGGDFAEVFVEDKTGTNLGMVGGTVESAISGRDFGIGIRILNGVFAVYAYTNDFSRDNLLKVARSAAQAIRGQVTNRTIDLRRRELENQHVVQVRPQDFAKARKIEWMRRAHDAAKNFD